MEIFILCIKIFSIRIIDVSLGTIRSIFTVKGKMVTASIIGFFEILVWFLIAREALNTDIDSILIAVSYALGFATGTYIGGIISDKLIRVKLALQIVLSNRNKEVIKAIRNQGYGVSIIDAKGKNVLDKKYMLFIEIDSRQYHKLYKLIKALDEKAFIVVNETKYVHNGYFLK